MTVKIGDTVAWADVPDGALVREHDGLHANDYDVRHAGRGWLVWACMARVWRSSLSSLGTSWDEVDDHSDVVTVIALDLTGQETAADLQRLAEMFDIREALTRAPTDALAWLTFRAGGDSLDTLVARLHAAGWRVGMTVGDAVRLLNQGTS